MASYLSKVADFDPPHLHLAPPQGVIPVEFRGDLWRQKTRVAALSCGVVCVILRLAVLVEHRLVTDRQTDRQTQGHSIYRRCTASCGKNCRYVLSRATAMQSYNCMAINHKNLLRNTIYTIKQPQKLRDTIWSKSKIYFFCYSCTCVNIMLQTKTTPN